MRIRAAIAAAAMLAVVALPTAAQAAAPADKPVAVLIDVHRIRYEAGPPGGGANCSNAGADSGIWTATGWVVPGPQTSTFNTTTLPAGMDLNATVSALSSAYHAWSQASPAPTINVATSTTSSLKPTSNHSYELMFGKTGGTTLAVTYTWRWSDGFVESDTLFNTSFAWGNLGAEGDGCYENAGNVYDVGNIATHEFGHTYGLGHPSGARFETMYAYGYSGETLKRSLASGDVTGANSLY
jgi:hypothetical protein